ncbi:hypothetical protein ULF88_06020 [Halopseudomonas pachastrellae]|nr:hypothetical protein [Halopseudomonas pachastrellae]
MDSQNSPSVTLPPGAYLLEGTRTPGLNSASRARAGFSALDLAVQSANALLLRCGLTASALDGVVLATGASQAADKVRLRLQLSPVTPLQQCPQGLDAVARASQQIRSGDADLLLVIASDAAAAHGSSAISESAKRLAALFEVAEEDAEAYDQACRQRHSEAEQSGLFSPYRIALFDRQGEAYDSDQTTPDSGACALLLASAKGCAQLKQRPLAQLSSQALARAPADYPSLAPLLASTRLLQKERLSLNDIDLWELPDAPRTGAARQSGRLAGRALLRAPAGAGAAHGPPGPDQPQPAGGSLALGALPVSGGCRQLLQQADTLHRHALGRALVCEQQDTDQAQAWLLTRAEEVQA